MLNDDIGLPPINTNQKRIRKLQKVNLKSLGKSLNIDSFYENDDNKFTDFLNSVVNIDKARDEKLKINLKKINEF